MVREIPPHLVIGFLLTCALLLAAYLAGLWIVLGRSATAREAVRRHALYLGVFYAALAVFLGNCKRHLQVDTQPAVFGAMSLVRYGGLDLTPFERAIAPIKSSVCIVGADKRTYSRYPPGNTLACVPFVLSFAGDVSISNEQLDFASKRSGAVCAALSVVILFAALRRMGLRAGAWIGTIAYAFGTTLLSTASQDAWQHAPAMLGIATALYGIARTYPDEPRTAALIGLGLAWAFISRPTMVAPAIAGALWFAIRDRRRFLWLALGAAPLAVFWISFASHAYGSPFRTGYSFHDGGAELGYHGEFLHHLYMTTLSASRGIFVYSPYLALAPFGFYPLLRRPLSPEPDDRKRAAVGVLGLTTLVVVTIAAWTADWLGGWSYGYRACSEVSALLAVPFAMVAEWLWRRWPGRVLVCALVAPSIGIHVLEYAFPNDIWNARDELHDTSQILVHLKYARYQLGLLKP